MKFLTRFVLSNDFAISRWHKLPCALKGVCLRHHKSELLKCLLCITYSTGLHKDALMSIPKTSNR